MENENNASAAQQSVSGEKFAVKVPWGEFGLGAGGARTWRHNPNIAISSDEQYRQNVANGYIVEPAQPSATAPAAEMDLARRIGMHLAITTVIDAVTAGKLAVDIIKMLPSANQSPTSATVNAMEQAPRLAGYIDRKHLVRLSNCRTTIWPGTKEIDAVPVYLGAPPADVCAEMRALCSSCGGTGDVHRADGEWMGECTCALAVAQRDAERNKQLFIAACGDLGLVSEALGLDPDDGGATPIIDAIKALQAGVPAGWKAVPIEPTEDMVIDGFESTPDRMFDGPDYPEEYDTMSGCQQAAFRAKRCWAAMLEAAPAAGTPP